VGLVREFWVVGHASVILVRFRTGVPLVRSFAVGVSAPEHTVLDRAVHRSVRRVAATRTHEYLAYQRLAIIVGV
jgi:hypothetical protein